MNSLLQLWWYGYVDPGKMISILKRKKNPIIGFFAVLIRSLLNSLLLFLPLFLMGKYPAMPDYLSIINSEDYFLFLTLVIPFYFIMLWLFLSAAIYLLIRFFITQNADFDHILNIFGLIGLIVGTFIFVWDWMWVAVGSENYVLLGISHLVIDIWAIVISTMALKRILGIKIWHGIILNLVWIILSLPLNILLMRSPL